MALARHSLVRLGPSALFILPSRTSIRGRGVSNNALGPQNEDASAGKQAYPIHGYYAGETYSLPTSARPDADVLSNYYQVILRNHRDTAAPGRTQHRRADLPTDTDVIIQAKNGTINFGPRLAGPGRDRDSGAQSAKVIAGIVFPPRPTEPDNCCMSGCVNCVWDNYREELEEWQAQIASARASLKERRGHGGDDVAFPSGLTTLSLNDSASPSHNTGGVLSDNGDDLYGGIPVGIREFMKLEKRLKDGRSPDDLTRQHIS